MARKDKVERPTKKSEYDIVFASRQAEKGWTDLKATTRNALVDSWDFLTRTPLAEGSLNYPLRGAYGTVTYGGKQHTRWQHKPTSQGDARIWFFVIDQVVYLEDVHTHHPNETK